MFLSLIMFFLCVNIISIKKINNISFISSLEFKLLLIELSVVSLIIVTTKIVKEEKIDDTEEYLKIKVTTTQVKINKKLNP